MKKSTARPKSHKRTVVLARAGRASPVTVTRSRVAAPAPSAARRHTPAKRQSAQRRFTRSELEQLLGSITCGDVMRINPDVEFVDGNEKRVPAKTTLLDVGTF